MRRYSIPEGLRHLRPSELVALIRSGDVDVLPFADAEGRSVLVSRAAGNDETLAAAAVSADVIRLQKASSNLSHTMVQLKAEFGGESLCI